MSDSIESLLIKSKPYLAVYLSAGDETGSTPVSGGTESDAGDVGVPTGPDFHIETAKNGEPVITVTASAPSGSGPADSRPTALASRYDPGKDADRLLSSVTLKSTDIVLILGLGNPVVLERLLPRLGTNQICLAVDAHMTLGRKLCVEYPGMLRYLARPGCHLFAGDPLLASLRSYIEGLPADRLSGLRVLRHPASQRLAPDFYDSVEIEIRDIIKSKMSDLLTRFEFEQLWLKNILINSRYLPPARADHNLQNDFPDRQNPPNQPRAATVGAFTGALAGIPGLLVSAGPSLRESLDLIAEAKSRCFILACDTAVKPLLKAGIVPHGVITLDAQRHTLFAFQGTNLKDTLFFTDLVSNPAVLRTLETNVRGVIFSTTAQVSYGADGTLFREVTPGTEHAELIHGPVGTVQSGGSVATSGFDLLRTLGCDPICIVGQDLAYTGRRIHTVGTHHQERWVPTLTRTRSLEHIVETVVRKRKTHPVPAIQRDAAIVDPHTRDSDAGQGDSPAPIEARVLGDYVLNLYRMWFDQSIPAIENRVVNLTAAGSHLNGAEHPADPGAFIKALPVVADPGAVFNAVRPPRLYEHERNLTLQRTLSDLLTRLTNLMADSVDAGASANASIDDSIHEFFQAYPYLRPLVRRSEVYLKRNREKLGEERAGQLARQNTVEALRSLWRGLRPFF